MNPIQNLPIYEAWKEFEDEPSQRLAWRIFEHYFDFFQDDKMQEYIWFLLTHAMTSEKAEINSHDRDGIFFFYEYSKILNSALFYIYSIRQIKKEKTEKNTDNQTTSI